MAAPSCSEDDFIRLFESLGAAGTARRLGIGVRRVQERRRGIENRMGRMLGTPQPHAPMHATRIDLTVKDGVVLIGSDAHYWPGIVTTAHKGLVKFCKLLKPAAVIMNGDVFDGAGISRHAPIGWEKQPEVIEEIETCKERLAEITDASPKADHIWTLGNHDARFETRLATVAPEYARVNGVHLKDHFPDWRGCWSVWINGAVVVKHRFRGGIHAAHNNVMWAGKTMVTGHLHSLQSRPFSDYTGTKWGVDTGTLAEPSGPQFDYTEDSPKNWRSGFVALTFDNGRLLQPSTAMVIGEGEIDFERKVYRV